MSDKNQEINKSDDADRRQSDDNIPVDDALKTEKVTKLGR